MKKKPTRTQRVKTIANKALNKALFGLGIVGALTTACKKEDAEPNTAPYLKGFTTNVIQIPEETAANTRVAAFKVVDDQGDRACVTEVSGDGLIAKMEGDSVKIYTTEDLPDSLRTVVTNFKLTDGKENGTSGNYKYEALVTDDTSNNYNITLTNQQSVSEKAEAGTVVAEVRDNEGNLVETATISGEDAVILVNDNGVIKLNQPLDGKTYVDPDTGNKFRFTVESNGKTASYSKDGIQVGPDGIESGYAVVDMFPTMEEDSINPTGNHLAENGLPFGRIATDTTFDDGEVVSVEIKGGELFYTAENTVTGEKRYLTKAEVVEFYEKLIGMVKADNIFGLMVNDNTVPEGWTVNINDPDDYLVHDETGFTIHRDDAKKIIHRLSNQINAHGADASNLQRWRKEPGTIVYNIGYRMLHSAMRLICEEARALQQEGKVYQREDQFIAFEKKMLDELHYAEGKL